MFLVLGMHKNRGALKLLVAVLTFVVSRESPGQRRATAQEADQSLNRNYQQLINGLSPPARENVRKAQRAWLIFAEKNVAAMRAAAGPLGISSTRCQDFEIEQVLDRSADFFIRGADPPDVKERFVHVDADLNSVYQRCLATLPDTAKAALREAQRAWIVFRDASRALSLGIAVILTTERADQLHQFYIQATVSPSPEKTEPPPPDPFERAK
jgi:uncharacterized protein YecT (DUF1311 family)